MYVPHFNAIDDEDAARDFVRSRNTGLVITAGDDGVPDATLLPVIWRDDTVVAHFAKANEHWKRIVDGSTALVVVTGDDSYIPPSWYAAKAEHGKVVPTWNYSAVELRGRVTVHTDAEWLREAVSALTDRHEAARPHPWAVADAPEKYVDGQLRAIVGVEIAVNSVVAKAKWSQNRSDEDRAGVIDGLTELGDGSGARHVRDGDL